tara:strand:+ start:370 stop:648 length:279 start_codon:yes stop_codon:yes gene_type:complete
MKPEHIEDYLVTYRSGQWFGWSDSKNKIYENLIVYDGGSKPTEQECTDGLTLLQTNYDNNIIKKETDKASANNKLKALGLTNDEIKAIKGIS